MPRASFSDVSKGGAGFQEGRVLILSSYSTMFQYPVNSKTGQQSDPFPALVWKGHRLDNEGKVVEDSEGNPTEVEIIHRMGSKDEAGEFPVRPGRLDPKDFDNLDTEPEDLGADEIGVQGNSFVLDQGAKFGAGWGYIEESLKKQGFKPEILGRCVTTDFVGMDAHFKMEKGEPYIAKKDTKMAKKGEQVTPTNLVCTRIFVYPYEKGAQKPAQGSAGGGKKEAATTSTKAAQTTAAGNGASGSDEALAAALVLFGGGSHPKMNKGAEIPGLSAEFRKDVPAGKDVKLEVFVKAMTGELMRRKVDPKLQKDVMDKVVKNADGMVALAGSLMEADKPTFMYDGDAKTINFAE